jgi:perosamine synthetase
MKLLNIIGDHQILKYDVEEFNFRNYLEDIYETSNLENLHKQSKIYDDFINNKVKDLESIESDLHKKFYENIKKDNRFRKLYCALIKKIHKELFPNEEILLYQSYPSIRFQFPHNIAVPPHCDSDNLGKHPVGEQNFLLPITIMKNTTRLFIETAPNKSDFQGIDLNFGELLFFNGNKCIHYNQKNEEDYIRISFDFRVITKDKYLEYIKNSENVVITAPKDQDNLRKPVKIAYGSYYQMTNISDSIEKMLNWYQLKEKIAQSRPHFDSNEADACYKYMSSDAFLTEFKKTTELETMIKNYMNVKHCFMVPSGTSAIITALLACDINKKDDVIVPDYTMVATVNAVKALGINPIVVDVNAESYTLDLETIKKHITSKTKAIIHVSLNNHNKNIEEIKEYCEKNSIWLIEDAAQSVGCFYNKKHYGTYGDIGCFSLSTPKIISTGQGGFLVSNSDSLAEKILMIKNFGRQKSGVEVYSSFGLNFKFTDIQSVIGIEQIKKLDSRVAHYKEIYRTYLENIRENDKIKLLKGMNDDGWIPWFITVITEDRDELLKFLLKHDVETRITYPAIHSLPFYEIKGDFTNSNLVSQNGLFLPTHMLLNTNDIVYVSNLINLFTNQ